MQLARVIGTVVASIKDPSLKGIKLMMVEPLDDELKPNGKPFVAVDSVQAGPNELVYLTMSREACYALPNPFSPVDAAITGIVDQVNPNDDIGIVGKEEIFER